MHIVPVSTHSRPKAAATRFINPMISVPLVSTHSRPKAAAYWHDTDSGKRGVSTHSRPKAAAFVNFKKLSLSTVFQHTAARRRLLNHNAGDIVIVTVSTHSRPKAAA